MIHVVFIWYCIVLYQPHLFLVDDNLRFVADSRSYFVSTRLECASLLASFNANYLGATTTTTCCYNNRGALLFLWRRCLLDDWFFGGLGGGSLRGRASSSSHWISYLIFINNELKSFSQRHCGSSLRLPKYIHK
jgi:hypothetical protein